MSINKLLIHMKYLNLIAIAGIILLSECKESKKEDAEAEKSTDTVEEAKKATLTHLWTTDTLLTTSESVIYDKKRDITYVSNIVGQPDDVDGEGFISKVDLNGKITDTVWVEGFDSPTGMGIHGDTLYVADMHSIAKIDIESGTVIKTFEIENSVFLNDITVTSDGKIYFSDSKKGNIHVIENDKVSLVKDSLAGPNGLLADNGKLLVALWNDKTLNTF